MFQYRYFYDETTHLDERAQRGDYGPGWVEYIRQAEQTRQFLQTEEQQQAQSQQVLTTAREIAVQQPSPATVNAIIQLEQSINERAQALAQHRVNLERMDDAIAQARAQFRHFMRLNLFDFNIRLSLIFAIGFLVFASLTFDLISLIWTDLATYPLALYSQSTFIASLVVFLLLFCIFLRLVQSQFRDFNKEQ